MTAPHEPCGGCGAETPSERCIGCLHDFGPGLTAPSNANTSGLEVVAWRSTWVGLTGRTVHQLHQQEAEAIRNAKWMDSATFEPLVTAASAQARIAELDEQLAQAAMMIIGSTSRATAAEARADRLAKAVDAAIQCLCTRIPGGVLHGDETMSVLRAALKFVERNQ